MSAFGSISLSNSPGAAAIFIVSGLPFLLYRAIVEDRVLRAELPGYEAYAGRVRWRLVPGIW